MIKHIYSLLSTKQFLGEGAHERERKGVRMNVFVYTHLMIITIFIVIKAGFMGKVKSIIHVFFAFKFLFFCQKQKKFFHLRLSGSVFITQSLSHLPGKSLFTSIKHRIGTYKIPNFFSFLPFSVKN